MPDYRSLAKRFLAAAGLAAAVAGAAALGGPAAGADTPRPVNVGTIITQSISALTVQDNECVHEVVPVDSGLLARQAFLDALRGCLHGLNPQ